MLHRLRYGHMIWVYVLKRLGHALLVLWVVTLVTFGLIQIAPGGPSVLADTRLTAEEVAIIERRLGIDRPIHEQYILWLSRLAQGDLGRSFAFQTTTVQTIMSRLPNTLLLAGLALLFTVLVAVPLGLLAGLRPNSRIDYFLSFLSVLFVAMPVFWLGLLLIILFAVTLNWLPAGGIATPGADFSLGDRLKHLILPVIVLSSVGIAEIFRYTRSSVRSVARQDFVRTARAKGLPESSLNLRHVLRNALIPIITIIGLQMPRLIGGAAVTETIFSWPGMGRLAVEAALSRDYPLIMGITLFVALAVVLINLIVDLVYPLVDPRIRLED